MLEGTPAEHDEFTMQTWPCQGIGRLNSILVVKCFEILKWKVLLQIITATKASGKKNHHSARFA